MIKISIIIPIYNSQKFLNKTLKSIYDQSFQYYEVIMIDDGSTDNSKNICLEYANKDNRFKYFYKKNGGVSSARNLGLHKAKGKFILFLDSDDYIEKKMLENMYSYAENNDIIICNFKLCNINGNVIKRNDSYSNIKCKNFRELILSQEYKIGGFLWNKLIAKNCLVKDFHEDISIMEDQIFLLENSQNINNLYILDEYFYNYVQHENSAINHKNFKPSDFSYLDSCLIILSYCNTFENVKYKLLFCCKFYEFKFKINNNAYLKILNDKYLQHCDKLYRELIKSKSIKGREKIKLFIKKHFNFIFKLKFVMKGGSLI